MKKWSVTRNLVIVFVLLELIVWGTWSPMPIQADTIQTQAKGSAQKPIKEFQSSTKYQVNAQVDPDKHVVSGTLSVEFPAVDTSKVYFHLYPNAFRERSELSQPNWRYELGDDRIPGQIDIQEVWVNNQSVAFQVHNTILEVPFPKKANQNQLTHVRLSFELKVPKNNGRLSYDDHAIWLGNWLPILAVKEAAGWRLDDYYPIGDPFFSEVADFDVQIRVPKEYQVATSGLESQAVITETKPKGVRLYDIQGVNIRDFAVAVMDSSYHSLTSKVGDTLVNTWYRQDDDQAAVQQLHDVAQKSLRYYSNSFGAYPYREYDVVRTGGFFGGMEYPGVVFIQDRYFQEPNGYGAAVVAHETAHQWFYGMVGSDEIREAWVDESLTDYAAMAFLTQYNQKLAAPYIMRRTTLGHLADSYTSRGIVAWQSVDKFPDWKSYSDLVYSRGATMLWELRKAWGEDVINEALRYYCSNHQYKNATGNDVIEAFTHVTGASAKPYFQYWLQLKVDQEKQAFQWVTDGKGKVHTK
ncbi:M1 family metallopeptidase [Brevibacillus ginsengisoli]|uniref:M1 family metallopeptidase n=1 Tax=Brevibacillus ginsengisoli TaxID=363854 RepID=UPI003CEF7B59